MAAWPPVARESTPKIASLASRPLELTYTGAKLSAHARLIAQRAGRPQPVLVHQMGKVASQAVAASLKSVGVPAYQIHTITPLGLKRAEAGYRRHYDPRGVGRGRPSHIWRGQWVKHQMARHPDLRWRVITLVRDPVARNVSSFFQQSGMHSGVDLGALRRHSESATADAVRGPFMDTFTEHELPLVWLDQELDASYGVDVYAEDFPHHKGYATYRGNRADVLLMRFEDLRRVFTSAVEDFLGLSSVQLSTVNVSQRKEYGDVYQAASRHLVLPEPYLASMYDSSYARHFYTEDERVSMRARWSPR